MIHLLFPVIFSEVALIVVLSFKSPLRKLLVMGLDRVKRSRGPVVVKTVTVTVLAIMMSSVYNAISIQKRVGGGDAINPTDQVLFEQHLLDSTLMGATVFLVLMIDRVHYFMKELRSRRKYLEDVKKQGSGFDSGKTETQAMEEEIVELKETLKQLESEIETHGKDIGAADATKVALRERSQALQEKHHRLIDDNYYLRKQLKHLDRKSSLSPVKKNS